jgi:protein TonB
MKMVPILSLLFITFAGMAQDSTKTTIAKDSLKKMQDDNNDMTFFETQIEASYPGGQMAWARFLNRTLRYPNEGVFNNIQGIVLVQFIVDKKGNTSDIKALIGPESGGLREEAVRVVKKSGKWVPAVQKGRQVNAYKRQVIVFKLD